MLTFRILGTITVEHGGRRLVLGRRRERCLLGILLLNANEPVSIPRLVDLLWDESPPADPRATLHTYVSRLRTTIRPTGVEVVCEAGGYRLSVDPDTVDALRFSRLIEAARAESDADLRVHTLREALSLWHGPVLADTASDRLRDRVAASWNEARLSATEAVVAADIDRGRADAAVTALCALIAEYPYRERFVALLMVALHRANRQADALDTYARYDRRIRDELGIEPGPELRDLHRRILAGRGRRDETLVFQVSEPCGDRGGAR
jgi:DNA-binding SARP family transcriptional activator